jgi:hypothetical protein
MTTRQIVIMALTRTVKKRRKWRNITLDKALDIRILLNMKTMRAISVSHSFDSYENG